MSQQSSFLRGLVTGIPSPTSEEPMSRWKQPSKAIGAAAASTSTSTGSVLQPARQAMSGSVRERARAYEQRHGVDGSGQLVLPGHSGHSRKPSSSTNASSNVNNVVRTAKGSSEGVKGGADVNNVRHPFPTSSNTIEDKENAAPARARLVEPENSSPSKQRPRSVYDLPQGAAAASPSSRPVSYQVPPSATPLTPRSSAKHMSNPAPATSSTSVANGGMPAPPSRPGTVQAGAFKQNRERANSTPRPSEWIMPASPTKQQVQSEVQKERGVPAQQQVETPRHDTESAEPRQRPASVVSSKPLPGSPVKTKNVPTTSMAPPKQEENAHKPERLQEQLTGPALVPQSQQRREEQSRPIFTRAMTEKPPISPISPIAQFAHQAQAQPRRTDAQKSFISPSPTLLADLVPVRHSLQMERAHSASEAAAVMAQTPATASSFPIAKQGGRPRSMTLTPGDIERAFEEMIDTLNLPSTVAKKMLGLDLSVKTGMLRSGTTSTGNTASLGRSSGAASSMSNYSDGSGAVNPRLAIPDFAGGEKGGQKKRPMMVRKMKSFMGSTIKDTNAGSTATGTADLPDGFMLVHATSPNTSPNLGSSSTSAGSTTRDKVGHSSSSSKTTATTDPSVSQSAAAQALMLKTKTLRTLDPIKDLKKLRVLLRNESLEWIAEWVRFGGYKGLMERLWEVLNVEWREEIHDDSVLMELLKCFRALLMTDCGRSCLASYSPAPFRPLMELLYSEKKPGDLGARQCIVEIIHGLFAVFPVHSVAVAKEEWRKPWSVRENFGKVNTANVEGTGSRDSSLGKASAASSEQSPQLPMPEFSKQGHARSTKSSAESSGWESAGFAQEMSFISEQHSRGTSTQSTSSQNGNGGGGAHALVKSLLIGPPNEKEEAKHEFIQRSHVTRIYKLWIEEIISVLSDYFWVFCHSSNTYWRIQNLEEEKVEEPKVPGGMTGGVEYEAMEYCASHLRLLNQLLRSCASHEVAQTMHADLFASGLEKVVLTLRKCSTTYYPQIHLELARYIDLSLSSGFPLHSSIRKHIEPVQSLSKSLSAGTIARMQAEEQKQQQQLQRAKVQQQHQQQQRKQGHSRSRTEGQVAYRPA